MVSLQVDSFLSSILDEITQRRHGNNNKFDQSSQGTLKLPISFDRTYSLPADRSYSNR